MCTPFFHSCSVPLSPPIDTILSHFRPPSILTIHFPKTYLKINLQHTTADFKEANTFFDLVPDSSQLHVLHTWCPA